MSSEAVHWLLYALILATTVTGWLHATFHGWSISFFILVPRPMLTAGSAATTRAIGSLHETMEWALLVVIGIHVTAARAHLLVYRDNSCSACCRSGFGGDSAPESGHGMRTSGA